jgi:hypothetical protein
MIGWCMADPHTAEAPAMPSISGSVVLELGPGVGALVLHAPPELDGREIEISACELPGRRTHALVRPRLTMGGTQYAAVYPGLSAGDYLIWLGPSTVALTVRVTGGRVTTAAL